jgi:hypothetical protein
MTVPIFDMVLEWRVLSMVMGGIKSTKELTEECNVSIEEIEELRNSNLLVPPYHRELSRNPDNWVNDRRYKPGTQPDNIFWEISDTGKEVAEVEEIPVTRKF